MVLVRLSPLPARMPLYVEPPDDPLTFSAVVPEAVMAPAPLRAPKVSLTPLAITVAPVATKAAALTPLVTLSSSVQFVPTVKEEAVPNVLLRLNVDAPLTVPRTTAPV
jgi:hypothetical protein